MLRIETAGDVLQHLHRCLHAMDFLGLAIPAAYIDRAIHSIQEEYPNSLGPNLSKLEFSSNDFSQYDELIKQIFL